ncbi:hypothetical protein [Halalkalicoccus sp. NIPERK01]|uniref:hypothetical protein n=1 Tax=Halalkalicoccus sp. NIPERK01 TaxID=3053469 RepID=UPI00256EBF8D|nr:hypothetical protein [Halalkalicoccus sp. NIPERK01]MDL5362131.1 hypothetical protein [Halalkalicoccus sp. NIPERK01]
MMTPQGRASGPESGPALETEFKWICPYCRKSRIERYAQGRRGEKEAIAALRSHIVDSEGDGHGPRNEAPVDTERTVFEYVCQVGRTR